MLFLLLCALSIPVQGHADLSVGLMPAMNSIPLVVAEKAGFFSDFGVNVRLVPFSGQLERETALRPEQ